MRLVARPVGGDWPADVPTTPTQFGPFTAAWSDTVTLLEREAAHLGADTVVVQLAISERDCRLDGWIRADARPAHDGVIVSLDSKHGPLRYVTAVFAQAAGGGSRHRYSPGWQQNVRAVALGLEALRRVDRYGISRSGEQYRGWNALPPAREAGPAPFTVESAAAFLAEWANRAFDAEDEIGWCDPAVLLDTSDPADRASILRGAYRDAARVLHPDAGGDPALFRRLTEARDLLERAS